LENNAVEDGVGFLSTSTPIPLLRNMPAVSSASSDKGRIAIIDRQTKYRQLDTTPQNFPHLRILQD
jgi:hypothetical protein